MKNFELGPEAPQPMEAVRTLYDELVQEAHDEFEVLTQREVGPIHPIIEQIGLVRDIAELRGKQQIIERLGEFLLQHSEKQ